MSYAAEFSVLSLDYPVVPVRCWSIFSKGIGGDAPVADGGISGDIYEQAIVKSITRRQPDFSKHLFGVIL